MVKHIKRAALLLCISLLSLHFVPAHAQEGFNNKKVLYGLHWGFTDNRVDLYYSDVEGIAHPLDRGNHSFYAPGFHIAVIGDVLLGNYFSLRAMPGVTLVGRNWEPGNIAVPESPSAGYKVESVCGELPVDVKFHPFRIGNLRPYLASGIGFSFDFTSQRRDNDNKSIQRLNAHDLRYICGLGLDWYTRYLRVGVELKAGFGLLSPDTGGTDHTNPFYFHGGPTFGIGINIEA